LQSWWWWSWKFFIDTRYSGTIFYDKKCSNQTVVIQKLVVAEIWRFCVMLCVAVLVQLSGSIGIAIKWWLGIAPSASGETPCGSSWMNFCKRTINQL